MATIQTQRVLDTLARVGHASNAELHAALQHELPELSLTSLHRITARLLERGIIGSVATDGRTVVLDSRPEPHDHFVCTSCGGVLDVELPDSAHAAIQDQLGTHLAHRGLVVRGTCAVCRDLTNPDSATSRVSPR